MTDKKAIIIEVVIFKAVFFLSKEEDAITPSLAKQCLAFITLTFYR